MLYAVGTIVSGRSGFDATDGDLVGSESIVEQIRRIRDDRSIRGIVLRIDSPGGSSVASDVILRELMITKERNPGAADLVVSMSDLAASGGYYIALAGDEIVAQPGTLTGSIGIYTGKIVYGGTLNKVGVTAEAVHSGRQRRHLLAAVARSRRRSASRCVPSCRASTRASSRRRPNGAEQDARRDARAGAGTRVDRCAGARSAAWWTGSGGLDAALAAVKERAGLRPDEEVEMVVYPRRRTFYEAFSEQFGGARRRQPACSALGGARGPARALASATGPARLFRRGEPLALMPFAFVR